METSQNNWHQKLKRAMEKRGVKQADLVRITGVKSSSVSEWINNPAGNITAENAIKICNYLNISIVKLFDNTCSSAEIINNAIASQDHDEYVVSAPSNQYKIMQFDAYGAMGKGMELIEQGGVIKEWLVSEDWLPKNSKSFTHVSKVCIVTGFGDSMQGLFNSGDPLLLDTGIKSVDFDGVYFFRIGNEGFIKRLQRIPGKGLRVISENKNYETWEITDMEGFEVFGKIIKAWNGVDI